MQTRDLFDYSDWSKEDLAVLLGPCPPEHRASRETYEWCSTNPEFHRLYPDHILAAIGRELLAADPDLAVAREKAKARCRELGYAEKDIVLVQNSEGMSMGEIAWTRGVDR